MRAGAAKPDISSTEALKKSVLAAKTIVLTPGPSNPFLHQLFDKMGIGAEAMGRYRGWRMGTDPEPKELRTRRQTFSTSGPWRNGIMRG